MTWSLAGATRWVGDQAIIEPACEVRIEQWSTVPALSVNAPCLVGVVTGHPQKPDGREVVTSPVILVNCLDPTRPGYPTSALTRSGTLYLLGTPHPVRNPEGAIPLSVRNP